MGRARPFRALTAYLLPFCGALGLVPPSLACEPPIPGTAWVMDRQAPELAYHLNFDPASPEILKVVLDLGKMASDAPVTLRRRTLGTATAPQISGVQCTKGLREAPDGTAPRALAMDRGGWQVPTGCRAVSWQVDLKKPGRTGRPAFRQMSLRADDGSWAFLTEPTALLRLDMPRDVPAVIGAMGRPISAGLAPARSLHMGPVYHLPPRNVPPAFILLGAPPGAERSADGLTVRYHMDRPRPEVEALMAPHLEGLRYLLAILETDGNYGVPCPSRDRFDLLWLGIERDRNVTGGAAGSRMILVNYLTDNGEVLDDALHWSLIGAFHEHVHEIAAGNPPIWLAESLAHYLALKTYRRVQPGPRAAEAWAEFVDPDPWLVMSLREANRRVVARNDPSAYGLFYTLGPSFWAKAEDLLRRGSGHPDPLDAHIPMLLARTGAKLPVKFTNALRAAGGPEAAQLLEDYVGE